MEQDLKIVLVKVNIQLLIGNDHIQAHILLHSEAASNYLSWICYRELLAIQHTVFSPGVATSIWKINKLVHQGSSSIC